MLGKQLANVTHAANVAAKGEAKPEVKSAPNGAPTVPAAKEPPQPRKAAKPKAAKKTAVKKTATKKTAKAAKPAKAPAANGRAAFPDDAVIKVLKTDHGHRGKRGEALDALLKDQSIEKFRAALARKAGRFPTYAPWALKVALAAKLISIKA